MAQAWERQPDPRWQAVFSNVADLQREVGRWPVGDAVAAGVASQLGVARDLIVDSYFKFDYSLIAAGQAFQALEACLRGCVPPATDGQPAKRTLGRLIHDGQDRGLLAAEEAQVLLDSTAFRNLIAHGKIMCYDNPTKSYTPRDALDFVEAVHNAVTDLYDLAVSRQSLAF